MLNKYKSEKSEAEETKQLQKAGDNASQFQANTLIVNHGISEKRAREIYNELVPTTIKENTQEAHKEMISRIERLENKIIPKLETVNGFLPSFADPYFQILLKKAQQAAVSTEREDDYALLSELLVCHVQKGDNRKNRAGIKKAIEIISDIDNDALCALTVAHCTESYSPVSGDIIEGLTILSDFIGYLSYLPLPYGKEWLDHLDVLGAVRISQSTVKKKIVEYYTETLNGYACIGIKVDSNKYKKAIRLLNSININTNILVNNYFLEGYCRLSVRSREYIKNIIMITGDGEREINSEEINVLEAIWDMYVEDEELQTIVNNEFMRAWDSFPPLENLRLWWDSLPCGFEITRVGQILAHTNARRCYPQTPDLI